MGVWAHVCTCVYAHVHIIVTYLYSRELFDQDRIAVYMKECSYVYMFVSACMYTNACMHAHAIVTYQYNIKWSGQYRLTAFGVILVLQ